MAIEEKIRKSQADVVAATADRVIVAIDQLISLQVDAVLHHPRFQRFENGWRGLAYLAGVAAGMRRVRLRVLDVRWGELARDQERAADFDQSTLFRMVYSDELGMPGGEPFGLLVADYAVSDQVRPGRLTDDVGVLRALGSLGAAAFCPVMLEALPELLGLNSFAELGSGLDVAGALNAPERVRWRGLRMLEDQRFIGVTLPRILLRQPWRGMDRARRDGFRYAEDIGQDGHGLLWGSAAWAFAAVVLQRFDASGWFADLRGASGEGEGGMAPGLAAYPFNISRHDIATQSPVEVRLSSWQEQALDELGFIPVSAFDYSTALVFNSNASLHAPQRYDRPEATLNARLSAMLQYVLCVSRFAHYVMVMMRDRVGAAATAAQTERRLGEWLAGYCLGTDDASPDLQARYPLRDASIEVREMPGRPGALGCILRLQPHYQLEGVLTSLRLTTEQAMGALGAAS